MTPVRDSIEDVLVPPAIFLPALTRVTHPVHGVGRVPLESGVERRTVLVQFQGEYLLTVSKRILAVG